MTGPDPGAGPASGTVVLAFVREPVPGRVKTRLARDLGAGRAARIYARMGRGVVNALRAGPWRTVVCFDPPDASEAVRTWLGGPGLELWPQPPGDLGRRMSRALEMALEAAHAACVVGTDVPDLTASLVHRAFAEAGPGRVVLGPATDGGYYLLALTHPAPALFTGIPWGTDQVLARTVERARTLGLDVRTLEPLSDVDTVDDLALHPHLAALARPGRTPPPVT